MGVEKKKKFLTVGPFECAWREELRFREAGRGCISFEASAQNDVTLVFREQIGSQHYHYKMDNCPHYTIILGSHRNRRLKFEVDGETVVDVAGVGLCCSSSFQSYWISIYDGLISVGKGRYPFQNLVFQWLDRDPKFNVQYIGLCSWDKHVGYRNITVLPLASNNNVLWSQFDYKEYEEGGLDGDEGLEEFEKLRYQFEKLHLGNFLESWEFSDLVFLVGSGRRTVPAHKVILRACGEFCCNSEGRNVILLPSVSYSVVHAFLEFVYTGRTQIVEGQLSSLQDLGQQFKVSALTKQCKEITDRLKTKENFPEPSKKLEIVNSRPHSHQFGGFLSEAPLDMERLKCFLATGESSDVNIHLDGHGLVAQCHKIILSLWSPPFAKMFTNGMMESSSSEISFSDVSFEAFSLLLKFMYCGELELHEMEMSPLLIDLLLLADQFGITVLQRECCKRISECLSEDTVCAVLQAVSWIPSCKMLEEVCKRHFATHFDYCTTASTDFLSLDESTFRDILQHADITVTSEERVLDAILLWCMHQSTVPASTTTEIQNWASIDALLSALETVHIFGSRVSSLDSLLPFVRFPLMPPDLLNRLKNSRLGSKISILAQLVDEAIHFSNSGLHTPAICQSERFQHRRSSFKELQYICDGDNNGVIYYAGTSFGEHQWVNPVLAKKITVTASSPASRYTDPKALVSRTYQATCFAGPRVENGRNCSWWMVDIGHDHQLMCNYYTLRQDGSTTFMRSWAFQGSLDGENWMNLGVHENDQTICRAGQFASWAVSGPPALLPFRFFRVILTGPTTGDSSLWNLCICFIELYGYFR